MLCGKKEEKLTLGSKVASDDPAQMKVNLGSFLFVLDKNFGLQPKFEQKFNKLPQKEFLQENQNDLKRLEQDKENLQEEMRQTKDNMLSVKKKLLIKQLRYEQMKAKLIAVLKEYEVKSDSLAEFSQENSF